MKVFVAGSFRLEEDKKRVITLREMLKQQGFETWNADERIGPSYGTIDEERIKLTVETEKNEIKNSDVLVAVLGKSTPGTMMELVYAYENKIPVIAITGNADEAITRSPWIKYHVKTVNNETEAIEEIKKMSK